MAFRSREIYKKISRKVEAFGPEMTEAVKKCLPNSKVIMGRAKRGIYAGRHIQFGNKVSEDGSNKSRRTWKPNVQEKRLFSYIHDRHIRVKVTTHALKCIDKAGGIDEYLLNTPYNKMDTELGLLWKARIEKLYADLGNMDVGFFSAEEEEKITKGFEEYKVAKREARREFRALKKQEQSGEGGTGRNSSVETEQARKTEDIKKAEDVAPNPS